MSSTSPLYGSTDSAVPRQGVITQKGPSEIPIKLIKRRDSLSSISRHSEILSPQLLSFEEKQKVRKREGRFHFGVWNGIHLKSPFLMVILFLAGISAAAGHHAYYTSLDHDQVGAESQQQWSLRFGAVFAYMAQIFLAASVGVAYTQWLWRTLTRTDISIDCLDAAFDADTAIISLLNIELLRKIKVGAFLALICWCLQLPSLITPATLTVLPTIRTTHGNHNVSSLDFYSVNQAKRFAVFVESDPPATGSIFLGPRTVISRLVTATATEGIILSIQPPFPNSTYSVDFYGPAIKCEPADDAIAEIIESIRAEAQQAHTGNITAFANHYYGFVPNLKGFGDGTDHNGVRVVEQTRVQQPMDASNELWMMYARYRPGQENVTNSLKRFDPVYTTCSLWNASYIVDLGFQETIQNVTSQKAELLNKIEYPEKDSPKTNSSKIQQAYSAVMWAISDLLVGEMILFSTTDPSYGRAKFGEINTQISHTSLLGSSDLRVHFDQSRLLTSNGSVASDQTLVDMSLARNRTLPELIEDLAFNVTMSFMNSRLLSPNVTANVTVNQSINTYSYSSRNLLIAYGLAILLAFIANILGAFAFLDNKASHSRVFSAKILTHKGDELQATINEEEVLKAPLSNKIKGMKVRFSVEKWAFIKVDAPNDSRELKES